MKTIFRFIGMIFKGIWKTLTFVRVALANLLFLLILAVVYFAVFHGEEAPVGMTTPSALVLDLSGPIVEQRTYVDPMESITGPLLGGELPKENVMFDVVDTIRHAIDDPNILGLVLSLKDMSETNLTKLRYIAKAIEEFKASGKTVIAVGGFYSQSQYYLASYADHIYMAPDGGVLIKGYGAYTLYYKTLLEKLDVTTHVFRVGSYKSAIEPFIRTDMSDEARASATRWLNQLWGAYVDDVATNRQIKAASLNPTMAQFLAELKAVNGDIAQLALNLKLVDSLASQEQVTDALIEKFGSDGQHGFNQISYYDYRPMMMPNVEQHGSDIAVVVASGAIMDGNQPRGTVGGESTAKLLREARFDDRVKAVVLRVDSPGGSAFASEVIRNEVVALRNAGKPVVVSMSSVAASGGYWISVNADKIIAQPTTLTGSIGIFSVITTFEKGLKTLGINSDGVGTTIFSGQGLTTGLSSGMSDAIQLGIEHGYQRFTQLVSQGRALSIEQVDKLAQGQVWTGEDALKLGLVDMLGDFDTAVETAAELAKLESYNLYWVEEPLSPAEIFLQEFTSQVRASLGLDIRALVPKSMQPVVNQVGHDLNIMSQFNDPKGHYSLCLTCTSE
ncbi:signal peptide peptidase SppA [Vibrio sp. SM6]|uniref:Signal peptide peptidase SppA n=1 Tax=Vibrio agarilyticus TaxID=2726741 RepID=A0A7X8TTV7_9VIBR|nr:signal peptide peptidase SppA [Vibrio agarilyticus]NLS14521.1 signal peptide peptidase SppA [Vibrio agarilyticus]